MGAWAETAFSDDVALDWLDDQFELDAVGAVKKALGAAIATSESDYLEYQEGIEARAAAEVVAIARGRARDGESDELLAQVSTALGEIAAVPSIEVTALAALDRVTSDNSEIQALWTEDGPNADWDNANADLRSRLS